MKRGKFLVAAGAVGIGLGIAPVASSSAPTAQYLHPDEALEALATGNARFRAENPTCADLSAKRAALVGGQSPFAIVLGCSDSRVPVETIFDQEPGELFVIRVAGNFATAEGIASMEYAVAHFEPSLLYVIGHSGCGAIAATLDWVRKPHEVPGHIGTIVEALAPAVRTAIEQPGDPLANAIAQNVRENVRRMQSTAPILSKAASEGKLRVIGGVYDLATGKVNSV
jgi:carbonic anhydrase